MYKSKDREQYRQQYPKVKKWLNQCVVCQSEGYKKNLPSKIEPGFMAEHIREYWDELEVDDISICDQCSCYDI